MAKRFAMQNPNGLWYNSDYHSRHRHGRWRNASDKRLYRSLRGLRDAVGYGAGVAEKVTSIPAPQFRLGLSNEEREALWTSMRERSRALSAVGLQQWVELHKQCGFIIHEYDI